MRDLINPRWMLVKALLFVVVGMTAAAMIWSDLPTLKTGLLLCLVIWAFARAYYFAFYVVEKYIDPSYRFSGLLSAARFLASRKSGGGDEPRP